MISLRILAAFVSAFATAGCATVPPCVLSPAGRALVPTQAKGVTLAVPNDATGPRYESDDYYASRPTWEGTAWRLHFVYGNGGLTEFMDKSRCCTLNDAQMQRKVCIGEFIRYGAMADISRVETPDEVSSVSVSIEPDGLKETEALSVIGSVVTNWEKDKSER